MIARTLETRTHGRYLLEPAAADPVGIIAAFHGYAESAEQMLARLRASPGVDGWTLVSVQGLNRFYQRRTDDVIAGWMTRQDRELAISDNIAYVRSVLEAVTRDLGGSSPVVFAGFSQGTAMAFRAAASAIEPPGGVVAVGGDIPPEIRDTALARCGRVLLCRGQRDEWYSAEKFAADIARLRSAGLSPRAVEFDGGHEWNDRVANAVGEFLAEAAR